MFEMSHLNSVGDIQIRERDVGLRNISVRFPATHWLPSFLALLRVWCGRILRDVVILPLEKHLARPHYKHAGSKGNYVVWSYTGGKIAI